MDIEKLFAQTVAELDRLLSTKTVVGDPIQIDGRTLIPLVSVGFGFGGGAGEGGDGGRNEGNGVGIGGGGGVRPVALVVADEQGVRLERVETPRSSAIEQIATSMGQLVSRREGEGQRKLPEERGRS